MTTTNNTNTANTNAVNLGSLKASVAKLIKSTVKGMTFNGEAYKHADLLNVADTISTDIIGEVFAITNMVSRLTGLVGISSAVASVMDELGDKPSVDDMRVMFTRINKVFEDQYEIAKACRNADNVEALKQVVGGGRSVFTYALAGLNALYGKVSRLIKSHMPKVEVKNQILVNFAKAIRTVASTLAKGFKLVLKGLRMGLSLAAALAIQCGRVLTHLVRSAVELIMGRIGHKDRQSDEEHDALEKATDEMMGNLMYDTVEAMELTGNLFTVNDFTVDGKPNEAPEDFSTKHHVVVYQASTQEGFMRNSMAAVGVGDFTTDVEEVLTVDMEAEDIESLLDTIFDLCNNDDRYTALCKYPMSVGDIVKVDDIAYQCGANGWVEMQ